MSIVERQSRLLDDCIDSLKIWKDLMNTHLTGNDLATSKEYLEEITKNYCSVDFEARKADNALKKVEETVNANGNSENLDVDSLFNTYLEEDNTSSNHFTNHIWKAVFSGQSTRDVEEVQRQSEHFNESDFTELNDSVQYSEVFQIPVDPMTKQNITDPYRNRVCGHVYEYKFVLEYIKSMKSRAKCPYMGCGNTNLNVKDLVKDDVLKRKIIEFSQRSSDE